MPTNNKDISHKASTKSLKHLPSRVLYVLVGVIAVVFVLFWLVGFGRPYDEDPNFNAPLFTDAVIVLMIVMVVCSMALAVWAMVRHVRTVGRSESRENNIPTRKISYIVAGGTFLLLLLTFALGSSAPMKINGAAFTDTVALKLSDMFISSSIVLIVAAIAAVVYGSTKYIRKP